MKEDSDLMWELSKTYQWQIDEQWVYNRGSEPDY